MLSTPLALGHVEQVVRVYLPLEGGQEAGSRPSGIGLGVFLCPSTMGSFTGTQYTFVGRHLVTSQGDGSPLPC